MLAARAHWSPQRPRAHPRPQGNHEHIGQDESCSQRSGSLLRREGVDIPPIMTSGKRVVDGHCTLVPNIARTCPIMP
jgi:hypothetical protein